MLVTRICHSPMLDFQIGPRLDLGRAFQCVVLPARLYDSLFCMWHDCAHASLTRVDRKEPSHSSRVSPACWVVSRVSTRLSADQKNQHKALSCDIHANLACVVGSGEQEVSTSLRSKGFFRKSFFFLIPDISGPRGECCGFL